MGSHVTPDAVRASLGPKFIQGLAECVQKTRADLQSYRETCPAFVAGHSSRGLANWIQDRLWVNASGTLADLPGVQLRDDEPVREVWVDNMYRLRLKRHSNTGGIASYPTQAAMDFVTQEPQQLIIDGLSTVSLAAGYVWDDALGEMGEAVISLHDGSFEKAVWMTSLLPQVQPWLDATSPISPAQEPSAPVIDTTKIRPTEEQKDQG